MMTSFSLSKKLEIYKNYSIYTGKNWNQCTFRKYEYFGRFDLFGLLIVMNIVVELEKNKLGAATIFLIYKLNLKIIF
jgi:hypothetical protein